MTLTPGANVGTVTWSAAGGNGSAIVGYVATALASGKVAGSVGTTATATSASLTDLVGSTSYVASVVAENGCGFGPAAVSAAATPSGAARSYAATVLAANPIAYYRFGELSADAIAADSSASHAHASYNTSVASPGQTGAVIGDSDRSVAASGGCCIITAASPVPIFNGARSVQAWVKPGDASCRYIAGWGTGTDVLASFNVGVCPGSVFVTTDTTGNDDLTFGVPSSIDDGNWHQVTVTYDGTTLTAYLDGQPIGSGQFTAVLDTQPAALEVGGDFNGAGSPWYGDLDELAVYGQALSASQVAAAFAAGGYARPGPVSGVTATAGTNGVSVTWAPPSPPPTPLTGYEVTASDGTTPRNAVYVGPDAVSAQLTGLPAGVAVTVSVQPINAYGRGPASSSSAVTPTGSQTTYASDVFSAQPSAYYRFSEAAGLAVAADSSGHAADLALGASESTGAPGGLIGDPDLSMSANGGGSVGSAPTAVVAQYNQPRTVEALIKPSDCSFRWVASWGYGLGLVRESFSIGASCGQVGLLTGQATDDHYFPFPRNIQDGYWHHIAITYDGNVTVTAYLDGEPLGSQALAAPLNTLNTTGLIVGGSDISGASPGYGGLDELAVYPTALSAAQIAAHAAASGDTRPGAPFAVTASFGSSNAATVAWGVPGPPGVPIDHYRIQAYAGGVARDALFVPGDRTAVRMTGLAAGTAYTFRVQAFNPYGAGPVGVSNSFTPPGVSGVYATQVLTDGALAYYRFSEPAGPYIADSSGAGADGTNAGWQDVATFNQHGSLLSDSDPGMSLNGGCCGASDTFPALPQYNQPRTVEAWVKPADANLRMFASWGPYQPLVHGSFGVAVAPRQLVVATYGNDLSFSVPRNIEDGNWHDVAVTYDGSTVTAYLDGRSVGTQQFGGPLDTLDGSGLIIGGGNAIGNCCGDYNSWYGGLDELAVYPTALSSTQIATHFTLSGHSRLPSVTGLAGSAGQNSVSLAWSPPAPSADAPLTGYFVAVLQGTAARNALYLGPNQTSTTISGLPAGQAVSAEVIPLNAYGGGAPATTALLTPAGASATYASTVLSHAPSVYYRFSDVGAPRWADSSGHGANTDAGIYGNAISQGQPGALLNDADPAVSAGGNCNCALALSNATLPQFNAPRTVEAWVKPGDANLRFIAGWGYGAGGTRDSFDIAVSSTQLGVFTINDDAHFFAFPSAIDDGNWHDVAVTYDGSHLVAYLDGTSVGTQTFAGPLNTLNTTGLYVGYGAYGPASAWYGSLDEFAVYPTALSASQIAADYHASGR